MSPWKLLLILAIYNAHEVNSCQSKRGNIIGRRTSAEELKKLADDLLRKITIENNDPQFRCDAKMDTIAVGLCNGGLIITGNVKERRIAESSAGKTQCVRVRTPAGIQKMKYVNYGLTEALSRAAIEEVKRNSIFQRNPVDIIVIEERQNPVTNPALQTMIDKAMDHASKHAETKMQAYCNGSDQQLQSIGISKEPCEGCHEDLLNECVEMSPDIPGNKRVTNRRPVNKTEVVVRGRFYKHDELLFL